MRELAGDRDVLLRGGPVHRSPGGKYVPERGHICCRANPRDRDLHFRRGEVGQEVHLGGVQRGHWDFLPGDSAVLGGTELAQGVHGDHGDIWALGDVSDDLHLRRGAVPHVGEERWVRNGFGLCQGGFHGGPLHSEVHVAGLDGPRDLRNGSVDKWPPVFTHTTGNSEL